MQTGGVREQLSSPKQPFSGKCPLYPSVSYAEGTPFSPGMRKGGKRIRWAGRLTRQAKSSCKQACGCISMAVRVAFFNAGQWHQETTCSLASLLFSHSGSFFFIQQRNSLPDRRKPDKLEGSSPSVRWHTNKAPPPRETNKTCTQAAYAGRKGIHRCRCLAAYVQT